MRCFTSDEEADELDVEDEKDADELEDDADEELEDEGCDVPEHAARHAQAKTPTKMRARYFLNMNPPQNVIAVHSLAEHTRQGGSGVTLTGFV